MLVSSLPARPERIPTSWWGLWAIVAVGLGTITSWLHTPLRAFGDMYAPNSDGRLKDIQLFADAGDALLAGDWAAVYADSVNQAGPLQVLADALIVRAVQPVPFPLSWYLVQAVICAGILMLAAAITGVLTRSVSTYVRATASEGGRGHSDSVAWVAGKWGPVVVMVLLTAWNFPIMVHLSGHWWQLLVVGAWVVGGVLVWRGRPGVAGVVIASGLAWEPWAVFGGVFILWAARWRDAAWFVAGAGVTGLLVWGPFVVQPGFALTEYAWRVRPDSGWAWIVEPGSDFPWESRLVQTLIIAVIVGAAAWFARRALQRQGGGLVWWWAVWVSSVVVAARVSTDVWFGQYYVAPIVVGVLALLTAAVVKADKWVVVVLLGSCVGFFVVKAFAGPFAGSAVFLVGLLVAGVAANKWTAVRADMSTKSALG